ncbi:MAG: hypothetical protein E6929_03690 [Clostridium sp.]|nr:hypothetical protein [Clostridium sp.]
MYKHTKINKGFNILNYIKDNFVRDMIFIVIIALIAAIILAFVGDYETFYMYSLRL